MPQNFGCNMKRELANELDLDFWKDGKSIFEERARFYDALIAAVISTEYRPNAWIAGGYFIKYKKDKFQDVKDYIKKVKEQDVDIYVQYPNKKCFSPKLTELKRMIVAEHSDTCEVTNNFQKGVFCTFELKSPINIDGQDEPFNNPVSVSVMYITCISLIREFTFEPCKIAYKYDSVSLKMSIWYENGGKLSIDEDSERAREIKAKYKFKGLDKEQDEYTFSDRKIVSFIFKKKHQQVGPPKKKAKVK